MINNSKNHRVLFLGVLLITAFGFFLRFNAAVKQSFWQDEVFIYNVSKEYSAGQLLLSLPPDKSHPPLFYVLFHFWLKLADNPLFLRLPSILLSTLAIPFFFLIGKETLGAKSGLIAAAFYAVHPFFVNQGFQAKMYAPTYFFVAVSIFFITGGITKSNFRYISLAAFFGLAALFFDYSAIWYVISVIVTAIFLKISSNARSAEIWTGIIKLFVVSLVFASPLFFLIVKNYRTILKDEAYLIKFRGDYINTSITSFSGLWSFYSILEDKVKNRIQFDLISNLLVIFMTVLFVKISIATIRSYRETFDYGKSFIFLFSFISYYFPVITSYLISLKFPLFNPRHLWVGGMFFIFGIANASVTKRKNVVFIIWYLALLTFLSLSRSGFVGRTDWSELLAQISKTRDTKIVVHITDEDFFWNKLYPLTDYYLPKFKQSDAGRIRQPQILELSLRQPDLERRLESLARQQNIWLLYSYDPITWLDQTDGLNWIAAAQKILLCQENHKPCQAPVLVED